ncbi:excinuclease ABC, A subunit [Peptoniphilus duerdenii ATCC BAA-1640]|uniref:UvrABC system protein A n=1 Tax=Peptoniphilus duerdenii ATCC BAA-1640 TaxID=862517 RepID=E0NKZ5_9FIRM|nr:excinuclease ABC subunit UvrA [Peptoniphilus duerdenii]EFM25563.1 excinuclease ABC, A subunit [Peptoniphilus duerdenii ATCC BAA-1640]
MTDNIVIKGGRQHNLKNVNLTLPRNKFIVFTGLSGSGKSSLAFDTIYAEGQRRYVESLSSYARQFLGQMDKPEVESIEGMSPSISIDQKTTSKNPRSTVGTVTEIYDYLRLLFARVGHPYCPICGKEITSYTVDQMVDRIMELEERSRIVILAPVVRRRKGTHKKVLDKIKKDGFIRAVVDGEMLDITAEEVELDKNTFHDISIVVDRLIVKEGIESRLSDSLELALNASDGIVNVDVIDGETFVFSSKLACPDCNIVIEEITPRSFSFNSPLGACEVCNGLGFSKEPDPELIIPNKDLSISEGAIASFSNVDGTYYMEIFKQIAKHYKFSEKAPIKDAPPEMINDILYGTKYNVNIKYKSMFSGMTGFKGNWEGVIYNLKRRYTETSSDRVIDKIDEFMSDEPCPKCHGKRLKDASLAVKVNGKNIAEVTDMSIVDALEFFNNLKLSEKEEIIAKQVLKEIRERLGFLKNVGLDYLTMSRMAGTLSGGEAQRIRLATQIGSHLVGVIYVLDEPSIGLHQRDNDRLLKTLRELTDIGNTLIVVEHDEDTMRACDMIVDIGPKAGIHGGEIVATGSVEDIEKCERSITGQYLSGKKKIEVPKTRREYTGKTIKIHGAAENNLKDIDVEIPLGQFVCVTGVSGSGKSSLVNEILYKALASSVNKSKIKPGKYKSIEGLENIDKVVDIDQSPIGRTPRSNPATYTGTFDLIRDIFAMTNEAKMRGYKKGRFSFNVKGGRCEACSGDGIIKVEMHFLPDVYVPCEVCKGKRYNRETLQVLFKGKNISDVLDMTVEEAIEFFENHPRVLRKLETLQNVGLSYIKLGQPSTQLSGGEAQRIKLATELSKRGTGNTIYILDEPTTGLHTADIHMLIEVLQELVDRGNTVVVIEHNLDVIKTADHIIDLGPEGGSGGGTIVATGRPEEIVKNKNSYTGKYLKKVLGDNEKKN